MAREIHETFIGCQFGVRQVEVPDVDPKDGEQRFGVDGPRMRQQWVLDLIDASPFEVKHVHIPLDPPAKEKLVEMLTGVVIAHDLPAQPVI